MEQPFIDVYEQYEKIIDDIKFDASSYHSYSSHTPCSYTGEKGIDKLIFPLLSHSFEFTVKNKIVKIHNNTHLTVFIQDKYMWNHLCIHDFVLMGNDILILHDENKQVFDLALFETFLKVCKKLYNIHSFKLYLNVNNQFFSMFMRHYSNYENSFFKIARDDISRRSTTGAEFKIEIKNL